MTDRIVAVRASLPPPAATAADEDRHWVFGDIASPMSVYPEYRGDRASFGLGLPGTFVVEVETLGGEIGVGVSSGGVPACWIVEHHLARFVEGQPADQIEVIWDQMWRSTLHYGRRGLVVNAISAIDLALWDLLGRLRDEPVFDLIGGPVRDGVRLYATGPQPDAARAQRFAGVKLPLVHSPAEGSIGLRKNVEIAARAAAGLSSEGFFLAYDCWMSLDVAYALELIDGIRAHGFTWIEEPLPPDDYWGYAELRRRAPPDMLIAAGEHEATRFGFRLLIEMACCDIVQPDVTWCGGLTELLKIADHADAHGVDVVPHSSSMYSYHFVIARESCHLAEAMMWSPDGSGPAPLFGGIFLNEPLPRDGRLALKDLTRPGFGVELDRSLDFERPFPRATRIAS